MTKKELLKDLDERYGLVNLYRKNVIVTAAIKHKNVFEKFEALMITGYSKPRAVDETANYFKIERESVYRIIKNFKD